jgi:hypothetical protein
MNTETSTASQLTTSTFHEAEYAIAARRLLNTAAIAGGSTAADSFGPSTGNAVSNDASAPVASSLAFVDAISAGFAHIVVSRHLNLDEVPADNLAFQRILTTGIPATVLSITVCPHVHAACREF